MFFKNISVYRIAPGFSMSAADLSALLAAHRFQHCASNEMSSSGWDCPRGKESLVHAVGKQYLLKLTMEKKLLPASVVAELVSAKVADIEERQGFKPGRKQMKELKEQATEELMPRAFTVRSSVMLWLDLKNNWLVIDTSSAAKSDDVIRHVIRNVDALKVRALRVKTAPAGAMTTWLAIDEAPLHFTVDRDTELVAPGDEKSKVRFVSHTLETDDVKSHLKQGKQCTRLAMTWADKISFVLDESLSIRKIAPLDVLKESAQSGGDADERFDGDFTLMALELNVLLSDIVDALDGELERVSDVDQKVNIHAEPALLAA